VWQYRHAKYFNAHQPLSARSKRTHPQARRPAYWWSDKYPCSDVLVTANEDDYLLQNMYYSISLNIKYKIKINSMKVEKHKGHGISHLCIPLRKKTRQHHNVCNNKIHNCGYFFFATVLNMLFQILNIFDISIHKVIQEECFTVVSSWTHQPRAQYLSPTCNIPLQCSRNPYSFILFRNKFKNTIKQSSL